jgi:ubiquinone/menaquinone biosynthesis C-methylase UbiE
MSNNLVNYRTPFDELAGDYDDEFTDTILGRILRARTHEYLEQLFLPGSDVLDINCGTGEDAAFLASHGVRVTAIDESEKMIQHSRSKILQRGLSDKVMLNVGRFEHLDTLLEPDRIFDGIISNFGGINCAEDINSLARILSRRVKTGGHLFLCIMGRWCPWEWAYLGMKGRFSRVRERVRGLSAWRGKTIRYYSPERIITSFIPYFNVTKACGLGFLLPPTYVGLPVTGNTRLLKLLDAAERSIESFPGIPHLSDHFVLVMTKK